MVGFLSQAGSEAPRPARIGDEEVAQRVARREVGARGVLVDRVSPHAHELEERRFGLDGETVRDVGQVDAREER